MIEALGRRDGTSKFHPDYRWCNFGAASIGWRISEESFIKDNLKWLDNLKLRASFGITTWQVVIVPYIQLYSYLI